MLPVVITAEMSYTPLLSMTELPQNVIIINQSVLPQGAQAEDKRRQTVVIGRMCPMSPT